MLYSFLANLRATFNCIYLHIISIKKKSQAHKLVAAVPPNDSAAMIVREDGGGGGGIKVRSS